MHGHQMEHPGHWLVLRTRPAGSQDGLPVTHDLTLHEQVAEPRMFRIRGRQGQDDLGVAGQIDGLAPAAAVGDCDPTQLDVILG